MRKIDYNVICQIYDEVREADIELINHFLAEIAIDQGSTVLDIGCGTGNYTALFQKITGAQTFGIDPAQGMLAVARGKNKNVTFTQGSGGAIPHPDRFFDFIFMTDVIHHIPDINRMFSEVSRVLKTSGKLCIVTQSHQQIDKRPTSIYFPGTATADKKRYPDIPVILSTATHHQMALTKIETVAEDRPIELGKDYLELVEKKGYSMFSLISDEEYNQGLSRLREAMAHGPLSAHSAGSTLLWLSHR